MPSKALEIVLITSILFFVYLSSIGFFQNIISKYIIEEDILKYSSNNFLLCLTIVNFSYGNMKCELSFEYKNIRIISDGNFFAIISEKNYFSPNLNLSSIFDKKVIGISGNSFYLQNNIENINIV